MMLGMGIRLEDCRYIELYSDYQKMHNNRLKVTYIVATLARKYSVSERKVYYLIDEFGKDCTSDAV